MKARIKTHHKKKNLFPERNEMPPLLSVEEQNFDAFLSARKLNDLLTIGPNLEAPIEEHAGFLFEHVFSKPYEDGERTHHGMPHACRAAIFASVLAHFFIRHRHPQALCLTSTDIKQLMMALLFHDAARLDDGVDYWDRDSAILLYIYLLKLGIDREKAHELTEAVANKDLDPRGYFKLIVKGENFRWEIVPQKPKNIYQEIIQSADCLDIIRVVQPFKGKKLDVYKSIVAIKEDVLEELAQLICEARRLIVATGDSIQMRDPLLKKQYESKDGFSRILNIIFIKSEHYPILSTLYSGEGLHLKRIIRQPLITIPVFDSNKVFEQENVLAALQRGYVYSRSIFQPSEIDSKPRTFNNGEQVYEMAVEKELRKVYRRKQKATTSSKENRMEKHGNPNRSVSRLGYGSGTFANAGFGIVDPSLNKINSLHAGDIGSGYAKKELFSTVSEQNGKKYVNFKVLLEEAKLGGVGSSRPIYASALAFPEILFNVDQYDFILCSNDPNLATRMRDFLPHRHSPLLEAIFLQNAFEKVRHKRLPIFKYSGLKNIFYELHPRKYDHARIKHMWVKMCKDFMLTLSQTVTGRLSLMNLSLDDVKVIAMYGESNSKFFPADYYYSENLKAAINEAIHVEKEQLENLIDTNVSLVVDRQLCLIIAEMLKKNPSLFSFIKERWLREILFSNTEWLKIISFLQEEANLFLDQVPVSLFYELLESNSNQIDALFVACSSSGVRLHLLKKFDVQWLRAFFEKYPDMLTITRSDDPVLKMKWLEMLGEEWVINKIEMDSVYAPLLKLLSPQQLNEILKTINFQEWLGASALTDILRCFPNEERFSFIQSLGINTLLRLNKETFTLNYILKSLEDEEKLFFLDWFGDNQLKQVIKSVVNLSIILNTLPLNSRFSFLCRLGAEWIKSFILEAKDFVRLFTRTFNTASQLKACVELFDQEWILSLIKEGIHISQALTQFHPQKKLKMFKIIFGLPLIEAVVHTKWRLRYF